MPFQGGQGVDFEGGLELAVASVEVRRCVIIEEHSNHDSVECADRGVQMYSADAGWLGLDPTVGDLWSRSISGWRMGGIMGMCHRCAGFIRGMRGRG